MIATIKAIAWFNQNEDHKLVYKKREIVKSAKERENDIERLAEQVKNKLQSFEIECSRKEAAQFVIKYQEANKYEF